MTPGEPATSRWPASASTTAGGGPPTGGGPPSGGGLPDWVLAPRLDGAGLSGVLPSAARCLGAPLAPGPATTIDLPSVQRACVVLVDGLGYENLAERAGHAPFLRSLLDGGGAITTVFPSTTAAAIGAFGTGSWPGRTGMVGYTQRLRGRLANMVSWDQAPAPIEVQREPHILAGLVEAGVQVTSVGPARFAGSGMTRAALTGGGYVPAESLSARVDATVRALRDPGLVYLYWGDVDKAGHHFGWQSWQWGDQLTEVDRGIGRLAGALPAGTLLVVTADHGMVDVDPTLRLDAAHTPALAEGVDLIGGEPRCVHVYTREAPEVGERWRSVLGENALVLERADAVAAGLFGPQVAGHVTESIGDVVVAMAGRATVVDSRTQTPASMALVGVHGSLTEREMRVPLLTCTL